MFKSSAILFTIGLIFTISQTTYAKLSPRVIYGNDDRAEIYDISDTSVVNAARSTVALIGKEHLQNNDEDGYEHKGSSYGRGNKLCSEERFYHQPNISDCSGFLVGEDLIVTAGHCVLSSKSCESYYFVFDYQMLGENKNPNFSSYDNVYSCKKVIERKLTDDIDYALIQLNRPVKNREPLKLQSSAVRPGDSVYSVGYPAGLPMKIADNATVRSTLNDYFFANLDTSLGNSGSAVFNQQNNEVVGILVRGEEDYSFDKERNCFNSYQCKDDECTGESVTNIDFIIKAIKKIK